MWEFENSFAVVVLVVNVRPDMYVTNFVRLFFIHHGPCF